MRIRIFFITMLLSMLCFSMNAERWVITDQDLTIWGDADYINRLGMEHAGYEFEVIGHEGTKLKFNYNGHTAYVAEYCCKQIDEPAQATEAAESAPVQESANDAPAQTEKNDTDHKKLFGFALTLLAVWLWFISWAHCWCGVNIKNGTATGSVSLTTVIAPCHTCCRPF